MDEVLVMVIVLKVEKDINLCTFITRWLDYYMPGLIGLIAWQKENVFLCDVRATMNTCRFAPDWQPIRRKLAYDTTTACSWPDMVIFRVLVQIRNNGQSTTLEQCVIMCDTWDRTASSFPAESCVNITKQIRNDFIHVGRCRFAFFSLVLVISTVFPANITRVVKYGKTDWKQGAVQGLTPYPPSLTHTITADTDRKKRAKTICLRWKMI